MNFRLSLQNGYDNSAPADQGLVRWDKATSYQVCCCFLSADAFSKVARPMTHVLYRPGDLLPPIRCPRISNVLPSDF